MDALYGWGHRHASPQQQREIAERSPETSGLIGRYGSATRNGIATCRHRQFGDLQYTIGRIVTPVDSL